MENSSNKEDALKEIYKKIDDNMQKRLFDIAYTILKEQLHVIKREEKLCMLYFMFQIYYVEYANKVSTIFDYSVNIDELYYCFLQLKFYLRRIEFGLSNTMSEEMKALFNKWVPSIYCMKMFVEHTCIEKEIIHCNLED